MIKDQQHSAPVQRSHQELERERSGPGAVRAELPARQWTHILRQAGGELTELSVPLLEQLAQGVGNSALAELLARGTGDGPLLCPAADLPAPAEELEANPIVTAPPRLCPLAAWPDSGGSWTAPASPGALRFGG